MNKSRQQHWQHIYQSKGVTQLSWFQQYPAVSLELLAKASLSKDAAIIDVGAGASVLVDEMLALGYRDITLLDLSEAALKVTQQRLAALPAKVNYLLGDITQIQLPQSRYDFWHDRAAFHFLTEAEQQQAYILALKQALKPNGFAMIAAFAESGPEKCSGLPVQRYSVESLVARIAGGFKLLAHQTEMHTTPFASHQAFVYCLLQKKPD